MFLPAASPWILVRAGRQHPRHRVLRWACTYRWFITKKLHVFNSSMFQKGSQIIFKPCSGIQTWNGCTVAFLVWSCKTGRHHKTTDVLYQEISGDWRFLNMEQASVYQRTQQRAPQVPLVTHYVQICMFVHSNDKCTWDRKDASFLHSPPPVSFLPPNRTKTFSRTSNFCMQGTVWRQGSVSPWSLSELISDWIL